jgi:CRP/FNR family cyclic AMP-dependent transcriptional regulator
VTLRALDSEFAGLEDKSEHKRFGAIFDGIRIFEKRLVDFNLAPEIAKQLVGRSTNFTYSDGKIIFFSGAPGDMVYCVRRGMVALYAPMEDESRVLFRIAGPGDLLGYTNFLGERRSRQVWEAHARGDCELALITREHVARTLQTVQREVVIQLFRLASAEWSQQMTRWVRFLGLDYRRRLELVIDELASRFGVAESRGFLLTSVFNHSDFAEMIASSRPLVSKLIGELIAEGLLIQQGRQYIVPFKHHAPGFSRAKT